MHSMVGAAGVDGVCLCCEPRAFVSVHHEHERRLDEARLGGWLKDGSRYVEQGRLWS